MRHSRASDRRAGGEQGQEPDHRLEQLRCRRLRPRQAARHAADQEDAVLLCRRECRIHAAVPVGRA